MLQRAVAGLLASGVIDEVVVVVGADRLNEAAALVGSSAKIVVGGAERTDSVRAGLAAVSDAQWVLVHDAARPLTPPDMIVRVVEALRNGQRAVIPVIPVVDTVKVVDGDGVTSTPDRSGLRAVQTPQGFSAELLRDAYARATDAATDDAALIERLGERVGVVDGDRLAFKITTALDLMLAEAILERGDV